MDKWDGLTHRIQQGFLAQEPDAVMSAVFSLVAEFGRMMEQMSADLDRIATAMEMPEPVEISGSPPALDL